MSIALFGTIGIGGCTFGRQPMAVVLLAARTHGHSRLPITLRLSSLAYRLPHAVDLRCIDQNTDVVLLPWKFSIW